MANINIKHLVITPATKVMLSGLEIAGEKDPNLISYRFIDGSYAVAAYITKLEERIANLEHINYMREIDETH